MLPFPFSTKVPPSSQLHSDVRMAVSDPEELLPGSEGTWLRALGVETSESFVN